MKISDLLSRTQSQQLKSTDGDKRRAVEEAKRAGGDSGSDKVTISPEARKFQTVSQILKEDEETRAAKVAELKAKVADGSYSVSSDDVAQAIVSFARDNEQ